MKMKGYKSKDDISRQMTRIFNNHAGHRHYDLAQSLALKYNYNMSMTDKNKELHQNYMYCRSNGNERRAQYYIYAMGARMYPKSVYTK